MFLLRIIDHDFNLIGEITKFESLTLHNKGAAVGELSLKISRYNKQSEKLTERLIIYPFDRPNEPYEILHKEIELDENGKQTENWIVKAKPLKHWLYGRICMPPPGETNYITDSTVGFNMEMLVDYNCINPIDPKRKIPNLIIGEGLHRGVPYEQKWRYENLGETLEKQCLLFGMSFNIALDLVNKQFVFTVGEGTDRSYHQSDVPRIVFDTDYKTLSTLEYVSSALDYKSTAIVAGPGEGIDRYINIVNDGAEGLDRVEMFVDARDVKDTNERQVEEERDDGNGGTETILVTITTPRDPEAIMRDLEREGLEKLAEHQQEVYINGQINNTKFVYGRDWFVGDIVTMQHKPWGITADVPITEVIETHQAGQVVTIDAVFDNAPPTIFQKVAKGFNATINRR